MEADRYIPRYAIIYIIAYRGTFFLGGVHILLGGLWSSFDKDQYIVFNYQIILYQNFVIRTWSITKKEKETYQPNELEKTDLV